MKKHSYLKAGGAIVSAVALTACVAVPAAFAANMASDGAVASWEAPTVAKDNTIVKDGKLCKVITEWSNAWASNGADYLGVSNSAWLQGNGGGDFSTDLDKLNTTLAGVWSTAVNENANPYNWNTYYNYFSTTKSDTATVDASYLTENGVFGPLKYRPEMIWYSNSFAKGTGNGAVEGEVAHINNLEYVTSVTSTEQESTDPRTGETKKSTVTTPNYETQSKTSEYYVVGDESYNPTTVVAGNGSPLRWVTSLNTAAHEAETIIADTADYNADGAVTADNVDYNTANALPRASRYDESPVECAVNVEKVTKGSVYYVLSQIAAGNVEKKKVAYVEDNSLSTDNTTVTVVVFDYTEQVGQGKMQGSASFSPICVDQLTTDNVKTERVANSNTGGANLSGATYGQASQDLPYTEYLATADELLTCDYIYDPNGATADAWQTWLAANATDYDASTCKTEVISKAPAIMQSSNFTSEKLVYGVFAVNSFYPELFPNMSLLSYWYDNVYHIKTDSVATCMQYACANSTITAGNELSGLSNYSRSALEADFQNGLDYYTATAAGGVDTEGTITRILKGLDLDGGTNPGSTTESTLIGGTTITTEAGAWNFTDFTPSDDWAAEAGQSYAVATTAETKLNALTPITCETNVEGATYTWQWSKDGKTWKNCTTFKTKNEATLKLYAYDYREAYQYRCMVKDAEGNKTYSNAVKLNVVSATATTTQVSKIGAKAYFTATTNVEGCTYQWQWKKPGNKWRNCSNKTDDQATMMLIAQDYRVSGDYTYRCKITTPSGTVVYTNALGFDMK